MPDNFLKQFPRGLEQRFLFCIPQCNHLVQPRDASGRYDTELGSKAPRRASPPLSSHAVHVRSSEKIGLRQFDQFITASVQNGLDHIKGKPFCHGRGNLGRHRKLHTLDSDVNDGRSIM